MASNLAIVTLASVFAAACAHGRVKTAVTECEPKERFIEIAKTATGWQKDVEATVSTYQSTSGTECLVLVWRLPETPGAHRTVVIAPDGKVLRVEPGK